LLLTLLAAPLALLSPLPLKLVVDSVVGSHALPPFLERILPGSLTSSDTRLLLVLTGMLVLFSLASHLQGIGAWLMQTLAGENLVLDFRARLFAHAQRLSLSYHDRKGTTDSTYRIQYDAMAIRHVLVDCALALVTATITLLGMALITLEIDWQLALLAAAVCPLLYLLTHTFSPGLRRRWSDVKKLDSSTMSVIQEVLSAVRVVKAFGREGHEHGRFLHHSKQHLRGYISLVRAQSGFDLGVGMTTAVGMAAVLFVGAVHVKAGLLTLGDLLLVIAYVSQLFAPLRTISTTLANLQAGLASAERAFLLLDEIPEVSEKPRGHPLRKAIGEVAFEHVNFGYDEGRPVLHDVSFSVTSGARVGIQGRTGSGKTTLMALLMRFYDPDSGRILVDGVDLRDYKLADLRNQFGIVLQEPILFSTTIVENIAYGRPDASEEDIVGAATLADAHDFVRRLPDGYNTEVGERGMRLSGGERQRIGLARAFLKDAPILILDEPTSSVDLQTETAIMAAMERLMRGRTTFIIAHRLSTLENCDLSLEVEAGRVLRTRHKSPSSAAGAVA
jgi:ATP-binding cassette subfamily B protein